jgi:hypothetical protein
MCRTGMVGPDHCVHPHTLVRRRTMV